MNVFGPVDDDGAVEFAFALVPAVRGQGLAVHTVLGALEVLRAAGATVARAEAEIANVPARRALEHAGLIEVSRAPESVVYETRL
ncbi:N-acetyltransferase [Agromyces protaetiae]|uniref:N-acetyltransferase n=1 Tax=Agromyces protaetiae TaxID=2509455 RepID=A0A4P6FAJ5_9MICO|nr:GNAT family N-acetyltransferase [Agromyces protaetiae]QAY72685.1 N-acetyltransferase [Agromyces protaetiae]